jgi:hypothetical protein
MSRFMNKTSRFVFLVGILYSSHSVCGKKSLEDEKPIDSDLIKKKSRKEIKIQKNFILIFY